MTDQKKILVIDDDPEILVLLKSHLEAENYEVMPCENGVRGIDLARTLSPDLIILDILLPDISGLKMCRILKGDKETKKIPILILTALADKETKIESFESEADDFLVKPIDKKVLISKINKSYGNNSKDVGR